MDIANQIRNLIKDQLDIPGHQCIDLSNLQDDLGADSLDCIEIMMSLEEHYEIEIQDEEFYLCKNVDELIAVVLEKLKLKSVAK